MKVLGIVGSPRIGGNTEQLTRHVLKVIEGEGIETELVRLAEMRILPCDGCRLCQGGEICPLDDDLLPLYQRLKEADGIILASPVFFGSHVPPLLQKGSGSHRRQDLPPLARMPIG